MTTVDIVALYDLDPAPALATARLAHCDLEFHRHRVTKDIWCIAVGPLGAFPFHVAGDEMLAHVRTAGQDTPRSGRVVEGFRVEIDENVAVVLRARGSRAPMSTRTEGSSVASGVLCRHLGGARFVSSSLTSFRVVAVR